MTEIDKNTLLQPTRAKGASTVGLDHQGRPKGIPAEPALFEPSLARATEHHVHDNIALTGKPKNHAPTPVHSNMRSRIAPLGGMIKEVHGAPDASSPQPLDIEPRNNPSKQSTVKITPGMRSRISPFRSEADHAALGKAVLAEGIAAESGGDHPEKIAAKLGRK